MNCSTRRLASISVCLILLGCVTQLRAQIASLSTKSLSFGSQVIATTPQKNVVLRNTGTSPLVIQSISQPSAPFSESSPPGDLCNLLPATLAPKASCTLTVTFSPTSTGSFSQGFSISIADNSINGSPQTISLSGTGIAPVTFSPKSVSFGNHGVGTTSGQLLTVNNNLTSVLSITSVTASGDFTAAPITPSDCSSIAARGYCQVLVTFMPTQLGARNGTITLVDNASTSSQTVNLSGMGTTASLQSFAVSPLNFSLQVSRTQQYTATGTFPPSTSPITLDVTAYANWKSSATKIATITNTAGICTTPGCRGLATALAVGTSTISATLTGITVTTSLFVKAPATVTLGNLTQTYTGGALMPTVTTVPAVSSIILTGAPDTNAGQYQVTASVSDPKYIGSASGTFTINQLTPTISVTGGNIPCDGNPHAATATATGLAGASVAGSFSFIYNGGAAVPVSVGNYPVAATFTSTDPNYSGATNSSASIDITGSCLVAARSGETATLLGTGQVLVTGGSGTYGGSGLSAAELYTPLPGGGHGTFATTDSLQQGVFYQTATLLQSGKVLVAGGQLDNTSADATAQAEVFDPGTDTFSPTVGLTIPRQQHTATLLPSGLVLIVGGYSQTQGDGVSSAELYDPVAGTFTATGSLATARYGHTATLLGNGMVLIVGGYSFAGGELVSAELYDPTAGGFSPAGNLVAAAGFGSTATLLPNGQVLIAAGINGAGSAPSASTAAELYDPIAGSFTQTGSLTTGRFFHTATLETDGKVLFVGGQIDANGTPTSTAELFDPSSGTFTPTVAMNTPRSAHAAARLSDGTVLIAGGVVSSVIPAPDPSTLSLTPKVEFFAPAP
jgi:hypothetical protein